ncbi:hypothetical protein [Streptococcus sp.]|uniref:hypothetical protein n=1 Tax=Streptococcus sp. TaxID=1306 RepID=UPI00391B4F53
MSTKKIKKQSTGWISILLAVLVIVGGYYFPQLTQESGDSLVKLPIMSMIRG